MPRAIRRIGGSFGAVVNIGYFGSDAQGQPRLGSIRRNAPDGDTLNTSLVPGDNVAVRFLGIDTPEKSLPAPDGSRSFAALNSQVWVDFLDDPFAQGSPYTQTLTNHIQGSIAGGGAAQNHHDHGSAAEDELERLIQADADEYVQAGTIGEVEEFQFFLRFAFEVLDGSGRFLAFINRDQPNAAQPSPRPEDYNTRMLRTGLAAPYFIWPNINPFRARGSLLNAVPAPGSANDLANSDAKLRDARQAVQQARANGNGIFDANAPLRLEAFEVRFLGDLRPPKRWVIDLSKQDDILVHPQNYASIPKAEDRLFINAEHVPLFTQSGWVRQQAPV